MGKIAPVSAKYIIHTRIQADGAVDKPDVIGAIFGQTEGLLGSELELRELQKSGRIGRIEVKLETKGGKTTGTITIPSSLDMAETAVVASALETIQRIGPCNAKITVEDIEDIRVTKREYVVERAKELLRRMLEKGPESAELMEEIKQSVRSMEMIEYGKEKLPAGPGIKESDEIIVVEGRADVINLLKNGFRNVIGLNGTSIPHEVAELTKRKTTTVFVDGDRGGLLIVKALMQVGEIDFVATAPTGKEVEELTKKEIHKCLRAKVPIDQFKEEFLKGEEKKEKQKKVEKPRQQVSRMGVHPEYLKAFKDMLEELIGTRGAYLLDSNMNILGKVPAKELKNTIRSLPDVDAIIMDEQITPDIVKLAERAGVTYVVGMTSSANSRRVKIITAKDLGI
ncbi:MAG: DNA primase [Nanoarchaeota archaeon]|nr:DNA primase [Nanoarchaeota archaeon]